MKKLINSIIIMALLFQLSTSCFADSVEKVEYTKQLVKGLGFEIENASNAYKRDTTEDENIMYTAFQLGLLKGVSWELSETMTDDEREIILDNAMTIYNDLKNSNDTEGQIGPQESDSEENFSRPKTDLSQFTWTTPYGTIKQPSDLNMNADIWSDEEFHEMLKHDVETKKPGEGYFRNCLKINKEGDGHRWYYNPENRHFYILTFVAEGNDYWIDIDERTNGRYFQTMKALLYNAQKYNMSLSCYPSGEKSVRLTAGVQDRGFKNISLIFTYDPRNCDEVYGKIEGYDATTMDIIDEWHFENLFDYALYRETTGEQLYTLSTQERKDYFKSFDYTESCYTNFLYGLLNQMYGADGLEIYHKFMYEYMYSTDSRIANDIETTNSHMSETTNHILFRYDPAYYDDYYAVINK